MREVSAHVVAALQGFIGKTALHARGVARLRRTGPKPQAPSLLPLPQTDVFAGEQDVGQGVFGGAHGRVCRSPAIVVHSLPLYVIMARRWKGARADEAKNRSMSDVDDCRHSGVCGDDDGCGR